MNLRNLFRRPVAAVTVSVEGERGRIPSVNQARSIQSRLASFLILGLVGAFCLAIATWYYVTQIGKLGNVERDQKAALAKRVSGDQKLRPLGAVAPPVPAKPASAAPAVGLANAVYGTTAPPLATAALAPQQNAPGAWPAQAASTPAQIERAFLLSGTAMRTAAAVAHQAASGVGADGGRSSTVVHASLIGDRRLLASKDTTADCTLRTAIDSTIPGDVLCVGATPLWSEDGRTILLEEGTKYIGETRGDVRQGQARIGIIWTEARTPTGVLVPMKSPGMDALGRAGVEGWVDNHFWDRFGAAVMLSLIDSSVAALAAMQGGGGTAIAINPSSGGTVAAEALKGTVAIPPTIRVEQGKRIQILLKQDIDFSKVYELRAAR